VQTTTTATESDAALRTIRASKLVEFRHVDIIACSDQAMYRSSLGVIVRSHSVTTKRCGFRDGFVAFVRWRTSRVTAGVRTDLRPTPEQGKLGEDISAWLHRAEAAGLTPEDITALMETTMRAALAENAVGPGPP
jgi:hypothetical protein